MSWQHQGSYERLWRLRISAESLIAQNLVRSKLNSLRDYAMCFLSIGRKILDEMIFVESIMPLQRRLGTKHIKSKALLFKTLCWQDGGRRFGNGSHHVLLQRTTFWEGSNILVVGPLLR